MEKHGYDSTNVAIMFIFPALGSLLYGFDIGCTSSVLQLMLDPVNSGVAWSDDLVNSATMQGFFISISTIGAMTGSGICYKYAEVYGRRWTLLVAAVMYTLSSLGVCLCYWLSVGATSGIMIFFTGNFFYGVAIGFAMHGAPAYIGEMSPASIRGFLISLKEGLVVLGMVLGYFIGWAVGALMGGWTYLYVFSAIVGIVMFLGTLMILPDSARWLASQGRGQEAMESLIFITPQPSETENQLVLKLVRTANLEVDARVARRSKEVARTERRRLRAAEQRQQSLLRSASSGSCSSHGSSGGAGAVISDIDRVPQWLHSFLSTVSCGFISPNGSSSTDEFSVVRPVAVGSSGGGDTTPSAYDSTLSLASPFSESSSSMVVGTIGDFVTPQTYPALLAGLGLVLFQQFTGQPSVLYYIDELFQAQGISTFFSVIVSLWKLVGTLGATFTVDNYGRKLLLHVGCAVMLLGLCVLIVVQFWDGVTTEECAENSFSLNSCNASFSGMCAWNTDTCPDDTSCTDTTLESCSCCGLSELGQAWTTPKIVTMLAYFLYIGGYQVGFGPISWLLISEIFPQEIRGRAVSVAILVNFGANSVCGFLLPVEVNLFGQQMAFLIYAVLLVWAMYFIQYYIPETKGLSLEKITTLFESSVPPSTRTGGTGGLNMDSYYNSDSTGGGVSSNNHVNSTTITTRSGIGAEDESVGSSTQRSVGPQGGAIVI